MAKRKAKVQSKQTLSSMIESTKRPYEASLMNASTIAANVGSLAQDIDKAEYQAQLVENVRKQSAVVPKVVAPKAPSMKAPVDDMKKKKRKMSVKKKRNMAEMVDEVDAGRGAQYVRN